MIYLVPTNEHNFAEDTIIFYDTPTYRLVQNKVENK